MITGPLTKSIPAFTREQLREYAAISGDDNLIHYDDDAARAVGFDGVIVHGMLSMAAVGNFVDSVFPPAQFQLVKFDSRFRKVVYPGDELSCHAIPLEPAMEGVQTIHVELRNGRGEIVCEGAASARPR